VGNDIDDKMQLGSPKVIIHNLRSKRLRRGAHARERVEQGRDRDRINDAGKQTGARFISRSKTLNNLLTFKLSCRVGSVGKEFS